MELVFFVLMSFMVVALFASKASEPQKPNATPLGIIPSEKLADCLAPKLEPAPPNVTPQQILQVHQAGRTLGHREMLNQLYNPVLN